jgi:hypothetical protein
MRVINKIANLLGDLIFAPFVQAPPWLGLVVLSALAGLGMMIVFKYTSSQAKLKAVSDRTRANLLAMKLFKDELAVTFASQWDLLKATGKRLWYSIWPPMAVMIVPFVLGVAQMGLRYEHRPLRPRESAVVSVKLNDGDRDAVDDLQLNAPQGVEIEAGPCRVESDSAVYWRVHTTAPGDYKLAWNIGGRRIEKLLPAGSGLGPASPRRPSAGWWDQLLYPLEEPFAKDSPVRCIDVQLPERRTPIFGLDVHWLISFFVLSMLFALILKPFLRVQL